MEKTLESSTSPEALLNAAYEQLEFNQGTLLSAAGQPKAGMQDEWLDRGDWQALAAQVGAETIFFVDRDPVIVFAKAEENDPEVLRKLYEQVWCMSRPQLFFLASPGRLAVYDLTKPPPRLNDNLNS